METEPWLKVSSGRQEKSGNEPATPGLQSDWPLHYNTANLNINCYAAVTTQLLTIILNPATNIAHINQRINIFFIIESVMLWLLVL